MKCSFEVVKVRTLTPLVKHSILRLTIVCPWCKLKTTICIIIRIEKQLPKELPLHNHEYMIAYGSIEVNIQIGYKY